MIAACRTYLTQRLEGLLLRDGVTHPYTSNPENIFFDDLPRDYLKDHNYAVCCLALQDRNKKSGKLIGKTRTLGEHPHYTFQRRRFTRGILFRCLLYGPADELWPATGTGLVEQFTQSVAEHKVIADADNSVIRIEPQEAVRPWDGGVEMDRKLRRPRMAIVRVSFDGGVQTVTTMPIIPSVEIVPIIGS